MIFSSLLVFILTATKPEPFLLQSTIDVAKVIGLPRLKTMDRFFSKTICINEVEQEFIYITYSRMEFIKRYIRLNSFNS